MTQFLQDSFLFMVATANHTFGMMYWIWIPAFLISWLAYIRMYKISVERVLAIPGQTPAAIFWAGWLGFTSTPHLPSALESSEALFRRGLHPAAISAFLIGSFNLVPYVLSFTLVLFGLEFFLGQLLGALAMAFVLWGLLSLVPAARWERARQMLSAPGRGLPPEPKSQMEGWRGALRYVGGEFRRLWLAMLIGLILAGLIGAMGRTEWSVDLTKVGGNGFGNTLFNSFAGGLFALILFVSSVGNLFAASFLWKAYVLNYAGVIAFILGSFINPRAIRTYTKIYGRTLGLYVAASGLLSAVAGALVVQGLFDLVGFKVTHVPIGHEYVGKLMEFFSLFGEM